MGGAQSQSVDQNSKIVNDVAQISSANCGAECSSRIDNTTIIANGGTGDILIGGTCTISNFDCTIKNYFQTDITAILDNMAKQNTEASTGFTFDFHLTNQTVNINQLIENSVLQQSTSSCKFSENTDVSNTVLIFNDHDGNITINPTGNISSSSCKLDNTAKTQTNSEETATSDQSSKLTSALALLLMIIVIIVIIVALTSVFKALPGGTTTGKSNNS